MRSFFHFPFSSPLPPRPSTRSTFTTAKATSSKPIMGSTVSVTKHIWDGANICAETNSSGSVFAKYYRGIDLIASQISGTSGLQYFRLRYLDTTTGRYLTEDPAKANLNWYTEMEKAKIFLCRVFERVKGVCRDNKRQRLYDRFKLV